MAVEAYLLEDDVLVEVYAVEGDVEEEPGEGGAEEDAQVAPFGEVVEEFWWGLHVSKHSGKKMTSAYRRNAPS